MYLIFKSRLSFNKFVLKRNSNKLEKGYHYFVEAMIAVANKDNIRAIKSHKKMNKYLNDDPSLSLLLKSEVYKLERKIPELKEVYELMIKSKKTETLGYRGLMEQNLNDQDYHHAFLYGEKLFTLSPSIEKLYETLVYITAKTKNWNQLLIISDKAETKKIVDRETILENKSIAHYEIAKIKSRGDLYDATKHIKKAISLKNNFPPYIKLHLELISNLNNISLLKKIIKKYWLANPTSSVRLVINDILLKNNLTDLNFIYQIIKKNSDYEESKKLLIFFAIMNQEWNIARENIKGLIGSTPSRDVCIFMADIELGENNDKQKSDSWIMRSEVALSENMWTCNITNKSQKEWNSIADSGYFNSLVISSPKMIDSSA